MKYPAQIYARAFMEVLDSAGEKSEEVTKKFLDVVAKNGDMGEIDKISRQIEKLMVKKNGGKFVEIELARKNDKLAKKLSENFSNKDLIEIKKKPELLAGARILIDGERELDFSFARKLRKLFSPAQF